jgi:hypothetical protein
MKLLLAFLFGTVVASGQQVTVIVQAEQTVEYDEAYDLTNTGIRVVYSMPMPVGQLQDAVCCFPTNSNRTTLSNGVVTAAMRLLAASIGTNTVTVKMP